MVTTWLRLDRDYTILGASGDLAPNVEDEIGRCLWDRHPDGLPVFLESFERAWENGFDNHTAVFHGAILQTYATRCDDALSVCFNVLTLHGLRESLEQLEAALASSAQAR